jgi:hypothetical protein
MLDIFQNLVTAVNNQTVLIQSIQSNLDQLEVGGGGTPYELPPATDHSLGGIIVGNNLEITSDGVLSATGGGGPTGPIYAVDVIYDNTTSGTSATEVQSSLDEIYALIGDVNTVLTSIL